MTEQLNQQVWHIIKMGNQYFKITFTYLSINKVLLGCYHLFLMHAIFFLLEHMTLA